MIARIRALGPLINYRHPLMLTIASTVTACLALAAFLAIWQAYENRPMRKSYPALDVPEIGLVATLRTERVENSVQYVFHAKAISDATKDRLDEVIRRRDRNSLKFFISLEDDAGFELCQTDVSWHPDLGAQGKVVKLVGKGILAYCPVSRYAKVSKWSMTFTYPLVGENLSPVSQQYNQRPAQKPDQHRASTLPHMDARKKTVQPDDCLTGADAASGEIETLSGRSFKVTREAERMTLFPWRSADKLVISCTENECLITDENNGQSVHARPVR